MCPCLSLTHFGRCARVSRQIFFLQMRPCLSLALFGRSAPVVVLFMYFFLCSAPLSVIGSSVVSSFLHCSPVGCWFFSAVHPCLSLTCFSRCAPVSHQIFFRQVRLCLLWALSAPVSRRFFSAVHPLSIIGSLWQVRPVIVVFLQVHLCRCFFCRCTLSSSFFRRCAPVVGLTSNAAVVSCGLGLVNRAVA
ncbi:hypothetical protein NQD34_018085 [Periophthalmus magnuspinnatus]|nr:hypothetical protein NQD34_018085 [Periophthalmus magnuspinnatus]